jgi:hypothetical protein
LPKWYSISAQHLRELAHINCILSQVIFEMHRHGVAAGGAKASLRSRQKKNNDLFF